MLRKSFLSLSLFTVLFHVTSYAQFNLVKDFNGGAESSFYSDYSGVLYSIGSKVVVQYDSVKAGQYTGLTTLAAVDKLGNSQRLTSIQSNYDNSVFFDFKTLASGKIVFISRTENGASKIIISDGTTAGSTEVYTSAYVIAGLEEIDNGLYFTYYGDHNHSLMHVDLTTLAVTQVKEFGYFRMISDISKVSNSSLIFMAPDAADNILKLYVSDGTSTGTVALATINTGSEFSQNTVMTQVGDKVYFFYKRPGTDCCNDLWVTDGTVAGTTLLKEFSIRFFSDFVREGKAIAWNNKFYFAGIPTGESSNNDESLWVSDGTVSGTVRLNDPADYKNPENFTLFKGELYFVAYDMNAYGKRLYITDGTATGTLKVNLAGNQSGIFPYSIAADATYLYLAADFSMGSTIFRFDGANQNCHFLQGNSDPTEPDMLYANGTDLYFTAHLSTTGRELYTAGNFRPPIGMATNSANAKLSVLYPNPAVNQITVKSTQQIVSLRLIGQLGTVLTETTENTLVLDGYAEGVYFVNIEFENGESHVEKIVLVK